jgi:predicted AAA+ superfamily ATPase
MVQRTVYLEKLKKLKGSPLIKVVSGVRSCGKSTLLAQFRDYLRESGVKEEQIIAVNLEDIRHEELLDYRKLYKYITKQILGDKTTYIFLDEIQRVQNYEKAVDSLFIKEKVDLYITGSNARLLSGELATLLSGRYIEINMLPLSFGEYFELTGRGDKREAFNRYTALGGFPYAASIKDEEIWNDYLQGIYHTILLKDLVERRHIVHIELLEALIRFLFDNIGNIVSAKKIADSLGSYGRKTTPATVEDYIDALTEAFVLYKANRFDVKGKQLLKSLQKYYIVDVGLRRLLLGDTGRDIGYILENLVYLELRRRGFQVQIGKVDDQELDFVAYAGKQRIYCQVAASILNPETSRREFSPLMKIKDNYPKYVLTMDELPLDQDGIRHINIIDFLLAGKFRQG